VATVARQKRKIQANFATVGEEAAALAEDSRALVARSCRELSESRASIARSRRQVTKGCQLIADSRRLLASVDYSAVTPAPTEAGGRQSAEHTGCQNARENLSVHVFQKGLQFSWTLNSPANEMLGFGMAETELKARTDAFNAGMTYIDRAKGRSAPDDGSLH
jgi:hypothetical protein